MRTAGKPLHTAAGAGRPAPAWLFGIAALLMGAICSSALAASAATPYLREAQAAFDKTLYPAAAVALQNALRIEPDNA
jgi:hypothetical protein